MYNTICKVIVAMSQHTIVKISQEYLDHAIDHKGNTQRLLFEIKCTDAKQAEKLISIIKGACNN